MDSAEENSSLDARPICKEDVLPECNDFDPILSRLPPGEAEKDSAEASEPVKSNIIGEEHTVGEAEENSFKAETRYQSFLLHCHSCSVAVLQPTESKRAEQRRSSQDSRVMRPESERIRFASHVTKFGNVQIRAS